MALQSLDIKRLSATSTTPPQTRQHVTEVTKVIDVTSCIGCKACQVACSEWNDIRDKVGTCDGTYNNPHDLSAESWTVMRFAEAENVANKPDEADKLEWLIRKDGCMHCEDPGCLKACPSPGAIVQYENGIVDFHEENCIGCGYCITGCPFNIPRISKNDNKAYKCTLCSDRVAVGQEPACVKTCPTGAIRFGARDDMLHFAEERVTELKTRGFDNAGVYNPQGVGGTHVVYVLHHADQPQAYSNLPKDPKISMFTEVWKGFLKPLSTFGIAASVLFGFLHFITVGPNDADSKDKGKDIIDPKKLAKEVNEIDKEKNA
ncbi:formate dehydrogenase subunit beta [Wohlfahrtiimonas larvae]|uniref:Formate dehydrogenase iron-sulfur subunit n=1 Tax=Wohlfahrtiimonas larvae TaxID=1157986 RepID=A0ABP9MM05_9GAMM|nr:formate dehydrogenase subunit beta [Wohlfahrtiimonas larvae]